MGFSCSSLSVIQSGSPGGILWGATQAANKETEGNQTRIDG